MKPIIISFLLSFLFILPVLSQNTLDKAGLTSATPAQVAFSLRKLSTAYTGPAIKVRRSSDNAEADLAFDVSGGLTASSLATFTPGIIVGATFGTVQTGTITSTIAKTGTITVVVNRTGTITVSNGSLTVTGTGTNFTTELVVGSLLYNSTNVFLGVVASITNSSTLLLTNYSTISSSAISYKTSTATVTGTGTNFTGELVAGDRIFNAANTYLGTVAAITSATALTLNAVDAVAATAASYKGTSATITGAGTSFTSLNPGDLLISNNTTLGIISTITSATSLTLATKAGGAVAALTYKSTTGTIAFSAFYNAVSVYVNTWYDQSGNTRNATQLKPSNQARIVNAGTMYLVNTRTSMEFSNALSAYLETSSVASYLNNSLYTLNKVTAEATINPNLQLPISTTGGNGPNNTISHYGYRSSSLFTVAQYGNDQNFNATPSTTLELHTSVKISTASSQFYKNGISLGVLSSGAPSNLTNVGLLHIGFYTPTVSYYNGSISELMVFSTALVSADITLLNNNQLAYYNIASTYWTGAVSTVWTDPGNWSSGIIPTISSPSIVVIPAGKPNYPVISAVSPANSISLEAGTSLTITGTLQLAGTLINLGVCTASSGTVQYVGTAPQAITGGSFTGNAMQNMIVNNSTGVTLSNNFGVTGNLTFTTGFLSLGGFTLTLGGNVINTVSGGLRGTASSNLTVSGAVSPTLSFDQTTIGTTNVLKNLTINSSGQLVTLANNLILIGGGVTTFAAGKLAIGSTTLTLQGTVVNTVSDGLRGSATANMIINGTVSPTLSFDQTTAGTTNALSSLTLNCTGQVVSLSRPLVISSTLTLTAGTLADGGNQVSSTGTINLVAGTFKLGSPTAATVWPAFATNNISVGGTAEYTSGVAQIVSAVPVYQNLTISATGGTTAANDLTVNGILNLSVANPSPTAGSLAMSTYTLNMGASGTTIGLGDVTGIIRRTTFLPNISYTMGNEFTSITFPNTGILPSQLSVKVSIGVAPSWRPGAIKRKLEIIQAGGSGNKCVFNAHYLDAELNGNIESNLVYMSYLFSGSIFTEYGKSNFNTTQNWIGLSNVEIGFIPSAFGVLEGSMGESTLSSLTWNGSINNNWANPSNWTPYGAPSTNTILIIPDASTTPNDPNLPLSASNGFLTIQSGGILNADPGAQLTLNNTALEWSNAGTFNAGNSNVIFTDAAATINGSTNFNNVTINSGSNLLMTSGTTMRIAGSITNNGIWSAGLLPNTVEYNGNSQTILAPNGTTQSYQNLIISGTGTNVLPAAALNILGDLTINGAISTVGNTINMNGSIPQAINGTAALAFNNLTINNSSSAVSLNQNLNVAGATTFTSGKLAIGNNTLTLSGNVVNTVANGIIGGLTSNLIINGTVSPTLSFDQSSPAISNALNNFTINSSGNIASLGSNLEVNGTMLLTAGKLAIGSNTLNLKAAVTNTVSGGLTGSSSSNLIVSGGTISPSLSFDQTTAGTTNLLNNFSINSTGQIVSLANPLIVGGSLNLTDGIITTTTANNLTLNATGSFTGGAVNSFVNGPLIRNTNSTSAYVFPVGKTNAYRPASVTPVTSAAGVYVAQYFPLAATAGTYSAGLTGIASNEYWDISKTSGPDAAVTLIYDGNSTWSVGSPSALDYIFVSHFSGSNWDPENGGTIPGNTGTGNTPVTSKALTSFSPFTFGYYVNMALPVTLLDFRAVLANQAVKLLWTTTNEVSFSRYELERSGDGRNFYVIASVPASALSYTKNYSWLDEFPLSGVNFYRLKMIDQDEKFKYSFILKIDLNSSRGIKIYPNPVTENTIHLQMTGQLKGTHIINLYNIQGVKLMSNSISYDGNDAVRTIYLNKNLLPGNYFLAIIDPEKKQTIFKILIH